MLRIYRTVDLSLLHSPNYIRVIAIGLFVMGGIFAEAWGDNWAVKCIYLGASVQIWLAAFAHIKIA